MAGAAGAARHRIINQRPGGGWRRIFDVPNMRLWLAMTARPGSMRFYTAARPVAGNGALSIETMP